jgi:hypothetical protein
MKKREFLAMGGALPLMVAGCGGSGSGTAQMRLVNASIGYPNLGLVVETTQATNADVAYGSASPFAGVPAGSVTTTLTTTTAGVVTDLLSTTRTLSGGARYSLVGYGYTTAPKSVVIVENQQAPDAGNAAFNVLNTSIDVGPIDVYLSPTKELTTAPIAASINGVSQSVFSQITAGTYVLTVVGAGTGRNPAPDIRLQVEGIALADQQIATLILSPGASGVLANGVLLTQGESGQAQALLNANARVRAVAATGNSGTVGVIDQEGNVILNPAVSPAISPYFQVPAGAAPNVAVDGVVLENAGTLVAGNDYTLLVYREGAAPGTPANKLIIDDNRLPLTVTGCKVRLINAVYDSDLSNPLPLTLAVNGQTVVANLPAASASAYLEVTALQQSAISVTSNFTSITLQEPTITLSAGSIYTELVVGEGNPASPPESLAGITDKFFSGRI